MTEHKLVNFLFILFLSSNLTWLGIYFTAIGNLKRSSEAWRAIAQKDIDFNHKRYWDLYHCVSIFDKRKAPK
ncbi:MAG TPA: hypothetical protein VGF75_08115 [Candidatus Saccharimonadales bacterium]|jgi:hypothetical protein